MSHTEVASLLDHTVVMVTHKQTNRYKTCDYKNTVIILSTEWCIVLSYLISAS